MKLFSIDDYALESIVEDYDHDAAEVVADGTEVTNLIESAEDQTSQVGDLQEAVDILDQQDNVSNEALEQFAILRDNVYRNLGMSPTVHPSYIRTATEDTSARMALKYALEQEKNFLQRAWDAVWKFLVDMWNKAKNFFMKIFGIGKNVEKDLHKTDIDLDGVIKRAGDINSHFDEHMKEYMNTFDEKVNDIVNNHDEKVSEIIKDAMDKLDKKYKTPVKKHEPTKPKQNKIHEYQQIEIEMAIRLLDSLNNGFIEFLLHRDNFDLLPEKVRSIVLRTEDPVNVDEPKAWLTISDLEKLTEGMKNETFPDDLLSSIREQTYYQQAINKAFEGEEDVIVTPAKRIRITLKLDEPVIITKKFTHDHDTSLSQKQFMDYIVYLKFWKALTGYYSKLIVKLRVSENSDPDRVIKELKSMHDALSKREPTDADKSEQDLMDKFANENEKTNVKITPEQFKKQNIKLLNLAVETNKKVLSASVDLLRTIKPSIK